MFNWDSCQLDQMLVFDEKNLDHILSVAIETLQPSKEGLQKPVSANIIFLCARYAHYWNTPELLSGLFNKTICGIIDEVEVGFPWHC